MKQNLEHMAAAKNAYEARLSAVRLSLCRLPSRGPHSVSRPSPCARLVPHTHTHTHTPCTLHPASCHHCMLSGQLETQLALTQIQAKDRDTLQVHDASMMLLYASTSTSTSCRPAYPVSGPPGPVIASALPLWRHPAYT